MNRRGKSDSSVVPMKPFERAQQWRNRHARGQVILVRFADDVVAGFQYRSDVVRFLSELLDYGSHCLG